MWKHRTKAASLSHVNSAKIAASCLDHGGRGGTALAKIVLLQRVGLAERERDVLRRPSHPRESTQGGIRQWLPGLPRHRCIRRSGESLLVAGGTCMPFGPKHRSGSRSTQYRSSSSRRQQSQPMTGRAARPERSKQSCSIRRLRTVRPGAPERRQRSRGNAVFLVSKTVPFKYKTLHFLAAWRRRQDICELAASGHVESNGFYFARCLLAAHSSLLTARCPRCPSSPLPAAATGDGRRGGGADRWQA